MDMNFLGGSDENILKWIMAKLTYLGSSDLVPKSRPTLCNSMDCSPPGSSVQEVSQARILECVAFPSPTGVLQLQHTRIPWCVSSRVC